MSEFDVDVEHLNEAAFDAWMSDGEWGVDAWTSDATIGELANEIVAEICATESGYAGPVERVTVERVREHLETLRETSREDYAAGMARLPSAEEVDGGEVRYHADEVGAWLRVSRDDVVDLGRRLREGQSEAYSRWCADTDAEGEDEARAS